MKRQKRTRSTARDTGSFTFGTEVDLFESVETQGNSPRATKSIPRLEGFRIIRELGRGGMGVVYLARQTSLGRLVAVKIIGSISGKQASERFHREAKLIAKMQHAGIASLYSYGHENTIAFFTMEFVNGKSLREVIKERTFLETTAAGIITRILTALSYAHSRNVIHRDLKPGNILLGKDGRPKIIDFGLAKSTEDDPVLTATGQIIGTPSYMSPEQASGEKTITHLSDIYSVGAVLYAMVTGRAPFKASSSAETCRLVRTQEPTPPHKINRAVSKGLSAICMKCLSKNPIKRYQSCDELIDELRRWKSGDRIQARKSLWPHAQLARFRRTLEFNQLAAAALAISVVISSSIYIGVAYVKVKNEWEEKPPILKGMDSDIGIQILDRNREP